MRSMRAGQNARSPTEVAPRRRERYTTTGFTGVSEALSRLLVSTAPEAQLLSKQTSSTHSRVRMAMLSGIAGFVDAAGFASVAGLFPAHITGELVGAVAGLSSGSWQREAARIAVLIVFVMTVVLGALISRSLRKRGQSPLAALFGLMSLGLLVASVSDAFGSLLGAEAAAFSSAAMKCGLVGAMALQNVVMRHALSSSCPTTVMTGNLTQFIIEFVELIVGRGEKTERSLVRSKSEIRLRVLGTALGAFLASAALSVFLMTKIGSLGILIPTFAIGSLALRELKYPTAVSRTGTLY
ncbi:MAG TPA: YoaK family protein [Polyangiaceae bacterium]|nr:YoaK family protein [Polyangiaceae bacterium]